MKRIAILLLLLQFLSLDVFGSELPDSSFVWTIRSIGWGQCEGVSTYMVSCDTLIGNRVYKQFFATPDSIFSEANSSYFCAARDSAGLWYFIPGEDSIEYLLYDFNVLVGETVQINNPWTVGEVDAFVISKDSILVGSEYKTRIGIGPREGELWEYWIEDIGCLSGLFYSCFFIFDIGFELSCTYSYGEFYHNFGYQERCGCWPKTSVEGIVDVAQVSIFPNPSNGRLWIESQSQVPTRISFYSIDGRLLGKYLVEGRCLKQITINQSGSIIAAIENSEVASYQIIFVNK